MKRLHIYIIGMMLVLSLPILMGGCSNNDDDVKVIFTRKTWKMSYIFREGNPKAYVNFWGEDRDAEKKSIELQKINGNYEVEFNGANIDGAFSGSFLGRGVLSTFTGTWKADAKNRAMSTDDVKWSGEETDVLAKQFQKGMNTAFKYSGDSNSLYIYYKDGEVTYVIALLPKIR